MSHKAIVIFHKNHPLDPKGVGAGAEMATILLARALRRLGREVYVGAKLKSGKTISDQGVTYINTGEGYDTSSVFSYLLNEVKLKEFDLIVASDSKALIESQNISEVGLRLFISHEPSVDALGSTPAEISRLADHVICVSDAQKAKMPGSNVTVVPNGADHELFLPGAPEERDYNQIVFVGALVIDKGVHHLVEAFAKLKQQNPKLKLDIYGSAAMWGRENYFRIEQAEAVPDVTFHGARPQAEIAEVFRRAGLLVLPSIYFDSFPLTVVEAQVTGLPVLGSTVGGMKEIIEDGVTGRLVSDITSAKLADEMAALLANPETLPQMSREALKRVRSKYSWETTAKSILKLLGASMHNNSKVGILTTYNQACGLATYASYLSGELQSEPIILAEDVPERLSDDGPNVERVWKRRSTDYSALDHAINKHGISTLHLNCHARFFDANSFARFLAEKRARGLKIVLQVHNPFTIDPELRALVEVSDRVVVHKPENQLEILANGGKPDQIEVIEHGIKLEQKIGHAEARKQLNITSDTKAIVCFGFVQMHKGLENVLQCMQAFNDRKVSLYIVGGPHQEDTTSQQYYIKLKQLATHLGLSDWVHFSDGFVSEEVVNTYLCAADAVVMNYRSQYYEASGAAARALGCGAALITSTAPAFASLGNAAFKVTTGFPLQIALERVLFDDHLNRSLRAFAAEFAEKHSWKNTAKKFEDIYSALDDGEVIEKATNAPVVDDKPTAPENTTDSTPVLRVLMQNRSNAKTHPGGDTVVMEKVAEGLRKRGVSITIDLEAAQSPADYDLVHLFNFATPDITEKYAKNCVQAGTPYVVTTMYEDLPVFRNQMTLLFQAFQGYLELGQPKERWEEIIAAIETCPRSGRFENSYTAENAEVLIASGNREKAVLHRDYPKAKRVETYDLGCEVSGLDVPASLFEKEYGVKDFILCVGRLETRKNQLMLLKALEDSDIPVVLAGGGFTYQPEYEQLCKDFKRPGKTLILGRLEPDMLASAYSAARAHVLPSWYELPGIVSMEAARRGKNIVVTDNGTARDYFSDLAYYCNPLDADSIYGAVMAAYYAPSKRGLTELVEGCTWDNAAERVFSLYSEVLESNGKPVRTSYDLPEWSDTEFRENDSIDRSLQTASDFASEATGAVSQIPEVVGTQVGADALKSQVLCDEADALVASGECDAAFEKYNEAIKLDSHCTRAYRGCAVVALQEERHQIAKEYFERALRYDPMDRKAKTGIAVALSGLGKQIEALKILVAILEEEPLETAALLHLIPLCYSLNRLEELEIALERYLEVEPGSVDIQYSLAGCYYKQGKTEKARGRIERILAIDPEHERAKELLGMLSESNSDFSLKPSGFKIASVPAPENKSSVSIEEKVRVLEAEKEQRNYDAVIAEAATVIDSPSSSADQIAHALVLQAEAYACSGELQRADEIFARLEDSRVFAHRALAGRGALAAAEDKMDEAEAFFRDALTKMPGYDVGIAGLGICALHRKDNETAWAHFSEALDKNSENIRALYGIIDLGYQMDRLEDMEKRIKTYLDYHPVNLPMLYSLAGCYFAQRRFPEARDLIEKVLLFDPEHAGALELREGIDREERGLQETVGG